MYFISNVYPKIGLLTCAWNQGVISSSYERETNVRYRTILRYVLWN